MAITSVDVDSEALGLAKRAYGVRTNREAINLALRDTVRWQKQLDAIELISTLDLIHPADIADGR
jgi:Arc/MetJ family transcription regulator